MKFKLYLLSSRDIIALSPEGEQIGGVEMNPWLLVYDVKVEPHLLILVPENAIDGGRKGSKTLMQCSRRIVQSCLKSKY